MDQKACSNRGADRGKETGISAAIGTLHSQNSAPAYSREHVLSFDLVAPACASPISPSPLPIKLIPIETVCEMLGLKRSATLAMVADRIIPRPIKFGTSRRAAARWIEQEIVEFIMKKAAERDITTTHSRRKEVAE